MKHLELKNISTEMLLSPFILIREFNFDPKMVLNPIFERSLEPYQKELYLNLVNRIINKTETGYEIISRVCREEKVPYYQLQFFADSGQVLLRTFSKKIHSQKSISQPDRLELYGKRLTLCHKALLVDSAKVVFRDGDCRIRNINFTREKYDAYGVLEYVRTVYIQDIVSSFYSLTEMDYQQVLSFLLPLDGCLSGEFSSLSSKAFVQSGSYEIGRHPELIERGYFQKILPNRKITSYLAYLYDERTDGLYDMRYSVRRGSNLSTEMLLKMIEQSHESEITILAMKERAGKRLILEKGR